MGSQEVIDFYVDSWVGGNLGTVRHLLAPDAELAWNLALPLDEEELVQTLNRIALFADSVTVVAKVCDEEGAALVYDCAAPFGTARLAEFLTVADGRITEVRQVYDTVAINRHFPGLMDD